MSRYTPLHQEIQKPFPYREAIGALMYLATCTRPDIALAVNFAARFQIDPKQSDLTLVNGIFRYVREPLR